MTMRFTVTIAGRDWPIATIISDDLMSQARRTWEVAYRAVITSLQLLDDYRTVMGIENGSGLSHVNRVR